MSRGAAQRGDKGMQFGGGQATAERIEGVIQREAELDLARCRGELSGNQRVRAGAHRSQGLGGRDAGVNGNTEQVEEARKVAPGGGDAGADAASEEEVRSEEPRQRGRDEDEKAQTPGSSGAESSGERCGKKGGEQLESHEFAGREATRRAGSLDPSGEIERRPQSGRDRGGQPCRKRRAIRRAPIRA